MIRYALLLCTCTLILFRSTAQNTPADTVRRSKSGQKPTTDSSKAKLDTPKTTTPTSGIQKLTPGKSPAAKLNDSITITPVSHSGAKDGAAIARASGGTPPYSYSWNTDPPKSGDSAMGLAEGTYVCTVKDAAGMVRIDTVKIGVKDSTTPPATAPVSTAATLLSANVSSIRNITSYGAANGTATVIATGGKTPYTYLWNTNPVQKGQTAYGLGPGTYSCLVKDADGIPFNVANIVLTNPLYVDVNNIFFLPPSYKKGNDGVIEIPVSVSPGNPLNENIDYQISYVIAPSQYDTVVLRPIHGIFYLAKLAPGNYTNITISTGNSNVATTVIPGTITLTQTTFTHNKAVQAAGMSAAIFYNYSGTSNDFPTGFTQYYVSGSCPLNKPDGISDYTTSFKQRLIKLRSIYGSFAYTDPSAFSLKTVDRANNKYVNQLDLFTHANVELNPNLNLVTYVVPHDRGPLGDDAHFYIDLNTGLLVTQVTDSVNPTTSHVYSVKSHFLGLDVAIKSTNFLYTTLQALATISIFGVHQNSNSVQYNLGPQYFNISDTLNAQNAGKNLISTKASTVYYNFSGQFMYNVNGVTKTSASNIYLRYSFITNFASISSRNYSNAFWAIQIGYILSLDKIFYPQSTSPPSTSASSIKGL